MNLSLARFNCSYFSLAGSVVVRSDVDEGLRGLMSSTLWEENDDGLPVFARFISSHSRSGQREASYVYVDRRDSGDGVRYFVRVQNEPVDEDSGPRPRGVKPVESWLDFGFPMLGSFTVQCHADFQYRESDGIRSRITFPLPITLPDEGGVTHTEAAEFSRRSDSGVEYSVIVRYSEEDKTVFHSVLFSSELELNRGVVRGLRDRCRSISRRLLVQEGVAENGRRSEGVN